MRVTIIVVCFCISLLLPEILCDPDQDRETALVILEEMASKNESIIEILRPSPGGCVEKGEKGAIGFTYKGILMKPNSPEKEVAIKFTHEKHGIIAVKEYEMYTFLNATSNVHVENYGIPRVFLYGKWCNFYLLGMTLLDKSLKSKTGNVKELDGLIICRDFVKTSKYIHGCGIRHDNINAGNIMFRRNNVFITDYKGAQKMTRNSKGEELAFHSERLRLLKGDWKSFLNTMCEIFEMNINNIMNNTDESPYDVLERVLYEFNTHISTETLILPYDHLYERIDFEIQLLSSGLSLVSFIKEEDRQPASRFSISTISGPSETHTPTYDDVQFVSFSQKYNVLQSLRKSHEEN